MHSLRPIYNIYKHISTHTAHLSTGNSLWKTHLAPPPHPQRSTHRAPTTPPKKMLQLKKCSYGSPITPPGHTNTGFRDLRFKNQRPLVVLYLKNKVKYKHPTGAHVALARTRIGPPTSKYALIEIRITLLIRSSFPSPENGDQFNEDLPNWGYPPVTGTNSQDG